MRRSSSTACFERTSRRCTYEEQHGDDPCATAAARSIRAILLQPLNGGLSALAIRRREQTAAGCYIADDSLRKREPPVLQAIATPSMRFCGTGRPTNCRVAMRPVS